MRHWHVIAAASVVAASVAPSTGSLGAQSFAASAAAPATTCATCPATASATLNTQANASDPAVQKGSSSNPDEDWHFTLAPYLLIPYMQGTTDFGNVPPVKVNVSPHEVFSHLHIGGMMYFQASKGPWSFGLDGIYMDLKQDIAPQAPRVSGTVSLQQGVLEGFVFRHISKPVELMVGGIGVHIQSSLNATLSIGDTLQRQTAKSLSEAWGAPVVGVRWTPIDETHWHVMAFGDIGALGSDNWTWEGLASAGYHFSKLFELALQFRALYADYSTGSGKDSFKYDVTTFGPQLGFIFHL